MSAKATVYKVELQISDIDRGYYQTHAFSLAQHASETAERLMVRVLAYALNADAMLAVAGGLACDDEPELWRRDRTGEIEQWIDLGQPDPQRVRRACGRARQVLIYTYSGRSAQVWWDKVGDELKLRKNLTVIDIPNAACASMAELTARTMRLQCLVQDGLVQLSNAELSVQIEPQIRCQPKP